MLYVCVCVYIYICSYYYICRFRAGGTHARLFFCLFRPICFGVLPNMYWCTECRMWWLALAARGMCPITTYTTMYMCCHTTVYMCPHTTIDVSAYYYICGGCSWRHALARHFFSTKWTRYYYTTRYHYVMLYTIIYYCVLPYVSSYYVCGV